MVTHNADVIIVGLGAMGSATIYQLAKRGVSVIGIDRFSPPHGLGSTHGDTRITRQATAEGEEYVPLVLRSHQIWRDIEEQTKTDLFTACGGLILTADSMTSRQHGADDFFQATVDVAVKFGIEHELMSGDEIRSRFPQFQLDEGHRGYYEPGAGFVRPEAAVAAQLELADRYGPQVQIRRDERVLRISATASGVTVRTDQATYSAAQAVIAAGAWVGQLAGSTEVARLCTVYRQALHWFAFDRYRESLARMPVFVWAFGSGEDDMFYGFPAIDGPGGGLKVATEQHRLTSDPDQLDQGVTVGESHRMFDHCVAGRLPLRASVIKTARCLYTVTPDHRFIIDQHPEHANVLIASPCSGHGFKHSAAIGEALAQRLVGGTSEISLSAFSMGRFR